MNIKDKLKILVEIFVLATLSVATMRGMNFKSVYLRVVLNHGYFKVNSFLKFQ